MPTDHIRYDLLAQDALRAVVREVLADVAQNGVPGEHHFYITFDTRVPGVKMSQRLRVQYPEEMRIVLQHQFWDLSVTDEMFEVGLSFGGVPERLSVPFASVTAFHDPSVQFALQFTTIREEAAAPSAPSGKTAGTKSGADARSRPTEPAPKAPATDAAVTAPQAPATPEKTDSEPSPGSGGAEVVSLDRFRKK